MAHVVVQLKNELSRLSVNIGTSSISCAPSARSRSWDIDIMKNVGWLIARLTTINCSAICASFVIKSSAETVSELITIMNHR